MHNIKILNEDNCLEIMRTFFLHPNQQIILISDMINIIEIHKVSVNLKEIFVTFQEIIAPSYERRQQLVYYAHIVSIIYAVFQSLLVLNPDSKVQ